MPSQPIIIQRGSPKAEKKASYTIRLRSLAFSLFLDTANAYSLLLCTNEFEWLSPKFLSGKAANATGLLMHVMKMGLSNVYTSWF